MAKEPTKNDAPPKDEEKKPAKAPAVAATDEEVSEAIDAAVSGLKGKADRSQVVAALRAAAEILNRNDDWLAPTA